ncbi:MAG: NIPSNAP family protein [Myxococcales bacterium]
MITCHVRYVLDLQKLPAFEEYGRLWMSLITRLGGTHLGYFLPLGADAARKGPVSFPGVGSEGPDNVAVALYSFPDWEAYERYRREAPKRPECARATRIANETKCFSSYERTFLAALPGAGSSKNEP